MQSRTELGKIKSVEFGFGGYQDAMIGFSFELGSEGSSVCDFWGQWATKRDSNCKWTHEERITALGAGAWRVNQLLMDAKVNLLSKLKGVPIEMSFDGQTLSSWRVLKEVL